MKCTSWTWEITFAFAKKNWEITEDEDVMKLIWEIITKIIDVAKKKSSFAISKIMMLL